MRLGSASPRSTRSGPRIAGNGARDKDLKSIGVLLLRFESSDGGLVPGIQLHTTAHAKVPVEKMKDEPKLLTQRRG